MGILVYSLLYWVMQDLYHQPWFLKEVVGLLGYREGEG